MSGLIVELLRHIGSRKEVEQYLRHYASSDAPKLAVVKVGSSTLRASIDGLAASLSFLHRVGLRPVVILDGEPRDGGEAARRAIQRDALRLADALDAAGTRARPLTSAVFDAVGDAQPAEVLGVRDDAIASTLRAGLLPVIAPLGETRDGRVAAVDSDAAACALAAALGPHKVIFLTEAGGLCDARGDVVAAVNLLEDYDAIMSAGGIGPDARARLERIAALLRILPPASSVSITSPDHLARELFTHRGSGTLVRVGERVRSHATFASIDTARLGALLERCFGRKLDPAYFETRAPLRIYLAESYRAAAIFTREADIPYLDKFAVTTEAQGEGIGGSLWRKMALDHPRFFWRARAENPINAWYAQTADGFQRTREWVVFWIGLRDFRDIAACVERAAALPPTLRDHGSDG